jgi:hypothetical protein
VSFDPGAWLQRFVLPLVAGGDVRVQNAIGRGELDLLAAGAWDDDDAARRIADARQAIMAELLLDPPAPALDEAALHFAAAMQNLLFLVHPDAAGLGVRRSKAARVARFSAALASELPAPSGAYELAARHSMLAHLFDLGRDDVRVTFWAGKREFKGAEPPPRLLKWAGLRRVREERWRVAIVTEAVGDAPLRAVVAALLAASPLTDLLDPLRLDPPFELDGAARWLGDAAVARAVADRWLSLGLYQIAPQLTGALFRLYERKREREARLATAFVCHVQLLALLSAPARGAQERAMEMHAQAQAQAAVRDLYGLFAAAQRVRLGRPADAARDSRLAARIDEHAAACVDVCGAARVNELAALILRGTSGALALTASA